MDTNNKDSILKNSEIGQQFLDFYAAHGFDVIPGSSLLDPSVPMSFVMSAGLVQVERSAAQIGGQRKARYALLQNCFRYFDLETVGKSNFHLTLFQMAGAFAFGPIDRQACFARIWALLTQGYAINPEVLWVSYFKGGEVGGYTFEADEATHQAWRALGLPEDRIVGLGPEDNFWKQSSGVVSAAEAPKCGPNTEVFYDRGVHLQCGLGCRPGCRCGRFVEIQNVLLITWHLEEETGVLRPLDEPFVEVVMGVERLAMLLQGQESVFEIDTLAPLVEFVKTSSVVSPGDLKDQRAKILIDHLRALLFLTADGAPAPGRGGRARLIRKLTRGVLTSQKLLKIRAESFFADLIDQIIAIHQKQNSQLTNARGQLLVYIEAERKIFEQTLIAGERQLARMLRGGKRTLSGVEMVQLEKQHGLPRPILKSMLAEKRVVYDPLAYRQAYQAWYQQVMK